MYITYVHNICIYQRSKIFTHKIAFYLNLSYQISVREDFLIQNMPNYIIYIIYNYTEIVFSTIVDYELDMLKRMTFLNTRILIVTKSLDTLNYSKFRKNFGKKIFWVKFFGLLFERSVSKRGVLKKIILATPCGYSGIVPYSRGHLLKKIILLEIEKK